MVFDFIKDIPELSRLYRSCCDAEMLLEASPSLSATASRTAMESIVRLVYCSVVGKPMMSMTTFEMATDPRFENYIDDSTILDAVHIVRKIGNVAVHDGTTTKEEALSSLEQLHYLVGEVCIQMGAIEDYPMFALDSRRDEFAAAGKSDGDLRAEPDHEAQKTATGVRSDSTMAEAEEAEEDIAAAQAVFGPRLRVARFSTSQRRDEGENKRLFLNASLREAGWPISVQANLSLPECACIDFALDDGTAVDYLLTGRDNRPLAVVDYGVSKDNPVEGRLRVMAAVDSLEKKYGYRPVAYYTTGYHIFCIDPLGYPPRRVFGFHSMSELELLKQRALSRKSIDEPQISDEITNREYQKKAIKAVCHAFASGRRRSLLVMATGTGKTRVSISLADVLLEAGWVKNILFLADRTSLVRQAHKSFNKLLPNVTTSIFTGGEAKRDKNARIIFSTYQTMIKLVDGDSREFGIGRFDLIIVDEAHRSVFKKYGSLFKYFDALMVGLTATPRCEENKSTYDVFDLPHGKPDYAYELEEAIQDGYLVGFSVLDRTTELLKRGMRYDDLTNEEKEALEDALLSQIDDGDEIRPQDIQTASDRVINVGTINAMLSDLMENGLKIDAGDKLGKTIIFAGSHKEAEVIVEQFQSLYKDKGADFCKLIDSKVENNQTLIDRFGERDSLPQIAVSVDMLDTGIDVPDALNLVFFKRVRSKIKFLQMIGRGTRLSEDIFGPGLDKKGFLIFDYFDNFRYFSVNDTWSTTKDSPDGLKSTYQTSQTVALNLKRLLILKQLQEVAPVDEFDKRYRDELKGMFVTETRDLNNDAIEVARSLAFVNKYRVDASWDALTDEKVEEIKEKILPLFPGEAAPARVKSFDMLILAIEQEYKKRFDEGKDVRRIRNGFHNVCDEIDRRMEELQKLKSIPAVASKESLIASMRDADYLMDDFSLERAEFVRKELRDLMVYLTDRSRYYIIDLPDTLIKDAAAVDGLVKERNYEDKAVDYIENGGDPSLAKLRMLEELSEDEKRELHEVFESKLGSHADFATWSKGVPLLPFLRKQVGIADESIQMKFGSFMNDAVLDPRQLEYMRQIVLYAKENGDVTFTALTMVSPFDDVDIFGLFGQEKIVYLKQLVSGLHNPVVEVS